MQNQSLGQTILAVFLAPTQAFDGIKESVSWKTWVYTLLIVSLVISVVPLAYRDIALDEAESNLKKREKQVMADIPEEQAGRAREQFDKYFDRIRDARENPWSLKQLAGYLLIPLVILVLSSIFGLVLMGVGNFGMGGKVSFQQMLSVVLLSYFIGGSGFFLNMLQGVGTLELLVKLPFILIKQGTDMSFSPGLLFESLDSYIKVFINQLDLFRLWSIAVLGIAFAKLYDKSLSTGISVVFIVWLIFTALAAGGIYMNQALVG